MTFSACDRLIMHSFISFTDCYFNLTDKDSWIKFHIYSTKESEHICKSVLSLAKSWSPKSSKGVSTFLAMLLIYIFHAKFHCSIQVDVKKKHNKQFPLNIYHVKTSACVYTHRHTHTSSFGGVSSLAGERGVCFYRSSTWRVKEKCLEMSRSWATGKNVSVYTFSWVMTSWIKKENILLKPFWQYAISGNIYNLISAYIFLYLCHSDFNEVYYNFNIVVYLRGYTSLQESTWFFFFLTKLQIWLNFHICILENEMAWSQSIWEF